MNRNSLFSKAKKRSPRSKAWRGRAKSDGKNDKQLLDEAKQNIVIFQLV